MTPAAKTDNMPLSRHKKILPVMLPCMLLLVFRHLQYRPTADALTTLSDRERSTMKGYGWQADGQVAAGRTD